MAGIHEGTLLVTSNVGVGGIVNGDVIVQAGCRVRVGGIVNGDVVVEQGAEARVTGIVNGKVIENRGHARVTGMVMG